MVMMNTPPREDNVNGGDDMMEMIDTDFEEDDDFNFSDEDPDGEEEFEMEDIVDVSIGTFSKHNGSVFCCAVSPTEGVAATGGEDDVAYVWNLLTGSELFQCTGHNDSVTQVCFSHDGGLLATGDMGGHIKVWRISSAACVFTFDASDLNWLIWHPYSNVLFAGCNDGSLWMWQIPQGNTKSLPNQGSSAECGAVMKDGKRLVVGYSNGFLRIYDLKTATQLNSLSDSLSHSLSVCRLAAHSDNTIVLTGSLDGTAKLFNTKSGKLLSTLNCDMKPPDTQESDSSTEGCVEVVTFCPTVPSIAVTATLSGIITIWDISSQTGRYSIIQGCGTSCIVWHPTKPIFFSMCLDGTLRQYDALAGELLKEYTGHTKSILDGAISADGDYVLTVSDDQTGKIFKLELPQS